jgi:hypothetical protein
VAAVRAAMEAFEAQDKAKDKTQDKAKG